MAAEALPACSKLNPPATASDTRVDILLIRMGKPFRYSCEAHFVESEDASAL
jgi:hypothetical protein